MNRNYSADKTSRVQNAVQAAKSQPRRLNVAQQPARSNGNANNGNGQLDPNWQQKVAASRFQASSVFRPSGGGGGANSRFENGYASSSVGNTARRRPGQPTGGFDARSFLRSQQKGEYLHASPHHAEQTGQVNAQFAQQQQTQQPQQTMQQQHPPQPQQRMQQQQAQTFTTRQQPPQRLQQQQQPIRRPQQQLQTPAMDPNKFDINQFKANAPRRVIVQQQQQPPQQQIGPISQSFSTTDVAAPAPVFNQHEELQEQQLEEQAALPWQTAKQNSAARSNQKITSKEILQQISKQQQKPTQTTATQTVATETTVATVATETQDPAVTLAEQ